jgi:hypothetical protein
MDVHEPPRNWCLWPKPQTSHLGFEKFGQIIFGQNNFSIRAVLSIQELLTFKNMGRMCLCPS